MAPNSSRLAAVALATVVLGCSSGLVTIEAAAEQTVLLDQLFNSNIADGTGAVILPAGPNGSTNAACLTASGNLSGPLASCSTGPSEQGWGKLRLTSNAYGRIGGVFAV